MDDVAVRPDELRRFDPSQKRDPDGKWGDGIPGPGGGAIKDVLKLADKIITGDGEQFAGSDAVRAEDGRTMPMAWLHTPSGTKVRLGVGIDQDDERNWRGANYGSTVVLDDAGTAKLADAARAMREAGAEGEKRAAELDKELTRLRAHQRELIRRQYPNLSKADGKKLDEIDERIDDIQRDIDSLESQNETGFDELPDAAKARWRAIDDEVDKLHAERQDAYDAYWADQSDDGPLARAKQIGRQIDDLLEEQAQLHRQREDDPDAPKGRHVGYVSFYKQRRAKIEALSHDLEAERADREELVGEKIDFTPEDWADLMATGDAIDRNNAEELELRDEGELASGEISAEWGDLVYRSVMTDSGVRHNIAVRPPDAAPDWDIDDLDPFDPSDPRVSLTDAQLAELERTLRAGPSAAGGARSMPLDDLTARALTALEARMFTEEDHPRGQKGSANGGQFAKKDDSKQPAPQSKTPAKTTAKKTTPVQAPRKVVIPKGALGYDPASNHGTGYGIKGGDKNVHTLQDALNRLGFTDLKGRKLAKDGRLGPLTTSAVKKAQKSLGLKQDGIVTPDLLKKLTGMKAPGHTAGSAAGQAAKKAAPKRRPSHANDIRPARKEADAAAAKKLAAATGVAAQPRPRVSRVDYANPPGRSASHDLCTRAFDFETDVRGGDGRTLEGYAAVFNTAARIKDHQGDFDEVIRSGAFQRSIRARMPVLQFDHGKDPRIGGTPIGKIDALSEDTRGLHVRARLFSHPDVERVREAIAEGAVSGMSFRFRVPKGGDTWSRRGGDVDLREIRDTDIHELGPVVFPAYDSTTVSVRSMLAGLADDEMRALVRELADHFGLAADLTSLTGRSGTRSADGGDTGTPPRGERVPAIATPQSPGDARLLEQALKAIGAL